MSTSASGRYVGSRVIFKGKQNRQSRLKDVPTTGVAGAWQASVAPNGFVTGANMMEIVQDINNYKEANNFDTILFWMDGFSGHLSVEVSEYCKVNRVL